MNLLTKSLFFYIGSSLLVFFSGGYIFYEVLKHTFYEQVDNDLITEKNIIEEEIESNQELPDYSTRFGHEIEVILYRHPVKQSFILKDTSIADTAGKIQFYRFLEVYNNSGTKGYLISILQPFSGRYTLFKSVINMFLFMFFGTMLISVFINYFVSKRLWLPFYNTIREISRYDIMHQSLMNFPRTNISEFDKLNNVLSRMSLKIRRDFYNLKEFTEDASHEIQTPLAIIKSKLEILIQSENVTSKQSKIIQEIDQAVTRLSKLNSGLLLLTKIENNQYSEKSDIRISTLIEKILQDLGDFIAHKNLKVSLNSSESFVLQMNPVLAEILFTNLISNAIKHNYNSGFINIELSTSSFMIANSGDPWKENPGDIFKRFKRSGKNSDSIGLGLAIVKKICLYYNMNITHHQQDTIHTLILKF